MNEPQNNPIGILDSGVGGLSIYKEIKKLLSEESIIYLADQKNVPYGSKSPEEIYPLSRYLVEFLLKQGVKLIVVACNVISVTSLQKLRNDFPEVHIIGTVPVIKLAAKNSRNKKIGILSTETTAKSPYQQELIDIYAPDCQITIVGTAKLVPLVEKGKREGVEVDKILENVLKPFLEARIDTLALACTHFPFLEPKIQQIMGFSITLLDSSGAVARQTEKVLKTDQLLSKEQSKYEFYTTGNPEKFRHVANVLLGETIATVYNIKL